MTHEEIENAMKRHLDNGGTIKHLNSPYDNPNLNYDSMDHEERQMVYEITGVKNSGVKINSICRIRNRSYLSSPYELALPTLQ